MHNRTKKSELALNISLFLLSGSIALYCLLAHKSPWTCVCAYWLIDAFKNLVSTRKD